MYILLQDDQPIPWSSMDEKDCTDTLHCIKNCTRSTRQHLQDDPEDNLNDHEKTT